MYPQLLLDRISNATDSGGKPSDVFGMQFSSLPPEFQPPELFSDFKVRNMATGGVIPASSVRSNSRFDIPLKGRRFRNDDQEVAGDTSQRKAETCKSGGNAEDRNQLSKN